MLLLLLNRSRSHHCVTIAALARPNAEQVQTHILQSSLFRPLICLAGDWHRAVHVWLYAMDTQRMLLQKRTAMKDSWPSTWDISSAGHSAALSFMLTLVRLTLDLSLTVVLLGTRYMYVDLVDTGKDRCKCARTSTMRV